MKKNKEGKALRDYFGVTQDDMAMLLQVTRSQYSLFELGKRSLPSKATIQLAEMLSYVQEATLNTKLSVKTLKEQTAAKQKFWEEELIVNTHKQNALEDKIKRISKKYEAAKAVLHLANYLEKSKNHKDLASIYRSQALRDIEKNNEKVQEKLNMQLKNLSFYEQQIQKTLKEL